MMDQQNLNKIAKVFQFYMMVRIEVPQKVRDNCGLRSSSFTDKNHWLLYLHMNNETRQNA